MTFVGKQHISGDVYAFSFRPAQPLPHTAGQHGFLAVRGGLIAKPFSIASAPEDDEVMIATHVHANSRYKQALAKLQPGDKVKMRGPVFNFVLPRGVPQVVFLAQGIGITPYRSLLRHIANYTFPIQSTLLHVSAEPHIFADETRALATRAEYPATRKAFARQLQATVAEQPSALYYISGSVAFLASTTQQLKQAGVPAAHIKKDWFLGYDSPKALLQSLLLLSRN